MELVQTFAEVVDVVTPVPGEPDAAVSVALHHGDAVLARRDDVPVHSGLHLVEEGKLAPAETLFDLVYFWEG